MIFAILFSKAPPPRTSSATSRSSTTSSSFTLSLSLSLALSHRNGAATPSKHVATVEREDLTVETTDVLLRNKNCTSLFPLLQVQVLKCARGFGGGVAMIEKGDSGRSEERKAEKWGFGG
jgi:hypothetical protein